MWYDVLGVKPNATIEEVRKAYKDLENVTDETQIILVSGAYVSACKELGVKPYKEHRLRYMSYYVKNALTFIVIITLIATVSTLSFLTIRNTKSESATSVIRMCFLNSSRVLTEEELNFLKNNLKENGYEESKDEYSSNDIIATKTINDRIVKFKFEKSSFDGGDRCSLSISDEKQFILDGKLLTLNRSLATSSYNINLFNYEIQTDVPRSTFGTNSVLSETFNNTVNENTLVFDEKEIYKDESFYNYISEKQAIIDRDILITEKNALIDGR